MNSSLPPALSGPFRGPHDLIGIRRQVINLLLKTIAKELERAGIPTVTLSVDRELIERVRPPRAGYYHGQFGSVAGGPNWPEHQRRILDEALRWLEPLGEPGIRPRLALGRLAAGAPAMT